MLNKFILPSSFLQNGMRVAVVGAGGTGSAVISNLASMCVALKQLHGIELHVTVFDDDLVSPANIARQAFAPSDVGRSKCMTLVNRVNLSFGLSWKAVHEKLSSDSERQHLYIGCVDTRKARKIIQAAYEKASEWGEAWWLDCGNTSSTAQVVLGVRNKAKVVLPSAADLFPDMVNAELDDKDDAPSCSLPEALAKQDLFINRKVAIEACELLWKLYRHGETKFHGVFVNSQSMRVNPLQVDQIAWKRMGFELPPEPEPAKAVKTTKRKKREAAAA